jgi:hypothetical protein
MLDPVTSKVNKIMTLEQNILQAQARIFRFALRDHGLCLKAISIDSGIKYETLRSYAGNKEETAMMPISALCKLVGVIPDELLSQLLEPVNRALVENDPQSGDHDTLAGNCIDFASRAVRYRHPDSEAGVDISPNEDRDLHASRRRLRA